MAELDTDVLHQQRCVGEVLLPPQPLAERVQATHCLGNARAKVARLPLHDLTLGHQVSQGGLDLRQRWSYALHPGNDAAQVLGGDAGVVEAEVELGGFERFKI